MDSLELNPNASDVAPAFWQRPGTQQLIRFCIVGFSSTLVDKGILGALLKLGSVKYWMIYQTISFCLGVTNGFVWNRRWTFHEHKAGDMKEQYPKFFASNIVGLVISLFITKFFLMIFAAQAAHQGKTSPFQVITASLCAIPLVVVWNFSASKYWTFRAPKPTAL